MLFIQIETTENVPSLEHGDGLNELANEATVTSSLVRALMISSSLYTSHAFKQC